MKIGDETIVSVLLARFLTDRNRSPRWSVEPVCDESEMITLVARLDQSNEGFYDFRLFPKIGRYHQFDVTEHSKWFEKGIPVENLANIASLAKHVRRGFQVPRPSCI